MRKIKINYSYDDYLKYLSFKIYVKSFENFRQEPRAEESVFVDSSGYLIPIETRITSEYITAPTSPNMRISEQTPSGPPSDYLHPPVPSVVMSSDYANEPLPCPDVTSLNYVNPPLTSPVVTSSDNVNNPSPCEPPQANLHVYCEILD